MLRRMVRASDGPAEFCYVVVCMQVSLSYHRSLLKIGLPIVIGQLGVIVLSLADTLMLGHYRTVDLAAASFVNSFFNLAVIFATGFSYGLTPIVGRLAGEGKQPSIGGMLKHAKEEGVEFLTLHNPIEYRGNEQGRVTQMILQKMELGEPDASGRRRPVPIEGAIETIDVDEVVVSIGVSPNPLIPRAFKGLEVSRKGTIVVNESNQSALADVFAGGDIVRGGATVILAMGDGRRAAASMDAYLQAK